MFDKRKNMKGAKGKVGILRYHATDVLYGPAAAMIEDSARSRCFWRCTG
jgi:hypothetical protein